MAASPTNCEGQRKEDGKHSSEKKKQQCEPFVKRIHALKLSLPLLIYTFLLLPPFFIVVDLALSRIRDDSKGMGWVAIIS